MAEKILLSIAIPTWNRAVSLESLLNNIFHQIKETKASVEVCISNNGSTDNTREVVMNFKDKYPYLIKYNENEKNLGFDINLLKAIEIASGQFIWTFGDDDLIIRGGLCEVIKLIKRVPAEKTGLIFIRREEYFINKKTGEKVVCCNTVDKEKSKILTMKKKDIIGMYSPDPGFMSALVFNGRILKNIIKEEKSFIDSGIGICYIHVLLHSLMFLKYRGLDAISLNKVIILQELPIYKFFIEDTFRLNYKEQKRLNNLLLSCKYMDNNYASLFIKSDKNLRKKIIFDMVKMRALTSFNYSSYADCLKLFFQYSPFFDALLFSFTFSLLILFPAILLRPAYKTFLIVKYGRGWRTEWTLAYTPTKGSRRWNFNGEAP